MKRMIMTRTIVLLLAGAGVLPAATLTLPNVTARPDERSEANLVYRSDGAMATAIQFDLEYDTSLFAITATAGMAATNAGKSLNASGSRFIIMGLNPDAIADGTLVLLGIAPKQSTPPGSYPLRIRNIVGSDKDAKPIAMSGSDAVITVQAGGAGPQISAVANAATGKAEIASGAWVSVYGANFTTAMRSWGAADFQGGKLPTDLDGVKVYINAKPAYVSFISPGQINVLAPGDSQLGPVPVQVVAPAGRSQSVMVDKKLFSPGLFMFDPEGRKYVAAVHSNGAFVGKPGLYPGLSMRPVKPGDVVLLFGTGFGPTNPPWPDGALTAGASPAASPVTIRIGGVAASAWAGLAGPGLYQFNITVPEVTDGDQPVLLEVGGQQSPASAFITVNR